MDTEQDPWTRRLALALHAVSESRGLTPGRRVAGAVVAAVLLAVLMAVVAARHGAPFPFDRALHRWALSGRSAHWTAAARKAAFTGTGAPPYALAAGAGALASSSRTRCWRGAVVGVVALALAEALRVALATLLARPRPPMADWAAAASGSSLPSGHTTTSALVAIGLAAAALGHCHRWWTRLLVCALTTLWALAVGASRVYLGVHWPTDVLAGWLLATALACASMSPLSAVVRQLTRALPTAPSGRDDNGTTAAGRPPPP